ncbi:zinc ABC transporter substrate-binding protein [Acidiphilium sp. PA]|uniref:metal ABC transporter solute-binding protein, Zn/Mn family n=1 Tax=Acidiphilium sp. PA TaxID=2871705 RepID=UPI0022439D44|nr:zinc ABC transporter substrate-binding protein [Acidiphilium sp. PA]MCW8306348.1 zinc ABC transporter substrate-binding protein [Acidiphilium sp. PA]
MPPGTTITRRAAIGLALALAGPIGARAAAPIRALGLENQYADVIRQIGGPYVSVGAVESNPNIDPHEFEVSPLVARQIARAALVVENGLGYDNWANKIMAAVPNPRRRVIDVQHLLGLPDSTPNPHLWYAPATMPKLAQAIAAALAAIDPAHAAAFHANAQRFIAALAPWNAAIAAFKARYPATPVAVTEPVADALLQAMGMRIETPFTLQAAIMNGTDPSPQDVATQNALFTGHKVKLFVYNHQVTDPLTASFLDLARRNHIPVVGVYETMPTPGYTYQSWMLAEVRAMQRAVSGRAMVTK